KAHQDADPPHPVGGLRTRHERLFRRVAEECDELALLCALLKPRIAPYHILEGAPSKKLCCAVQHFGHPTSATGPPPELAVGVFRKTLGAAMYPRSAISAEGDRIDRLAGSSPPSRSDPRRSQLRRAPFGTRPQEAHRTTQH